MAYSPLAYGLTANDLVQRYADYISGVQTPFGLEERSKMGVGPRGAAQGLLPDETLLRLHQEANRTIMGRAGGLISQANQTELGMAQQWERKIKQSQTGGSGGVSEGMRPGKSVWSRGEIRAANEQKRAYELMKRFQAEQTKSTNRLKGHGRKEVDMMLQRHRQLQANTKSGRTKTKDL